MELKEIIDQFLTERNTIWNSVFSRARCHVGAWLSLFLKKQVPTWHLKICRPNGLLFQYYYLFCPGIRGNHPRPFMAGFRKHSRNVHSRACWEYPIPICRFGAEEERSNQ